MINKRLEPLKSETFALLEQLCWLAEAEDLAVIRSPVSLR